MPDLTTARKILARVPVPAMPTLDEPSITIEGPSVRWRHCNRPLCRFHKACSTPDGCDSETAAKEGMKS